MDNTLIGSVTPAVTITTVAGIAFAAGRLRERVTALSRHVTAELRNLSAAMGDRFDALDRRMSLLEELLPHVWDRVEAP